MLILMKLFHTEEYVFPADVKCKDQCGTNPHCKLFVSLYCGKEFTFFLLTALEKVSFVWPYFQGMWYVLALFDLCILSYLHIYNDGGHVKGVFVHLLSDFMIITKLEFGCLRLSVIQDL